MKLSLIGELSQLDPPIVTERVTPTVKPAKLLQAISEQAPPIARGKRHHFIGVEPGSEEDEELQSELEVIRRSNPRLYRKIISLD